MKRYSYTCEVAYKKSGEIDVPDNGNVTEAIKKIYKDDYRGNDVTDILRLEVKEVDLGESYKKFSDKVGFPIKKGQTVFIYPKNSYCFWSGKILDTDSVRENDPYSYSLQIDDKINKTKTWVQLEDNELFATKEEAQDRVITEMLKCIPEGTQLSIPELINKFQERLS